MNRPTFPITSQRFAPSAKQRKVRAGKRLMSLEACEPRCLLAGIPELIELNAAGASNPSDFVRVGDIVFFTAEDDVAGRELWRTDGSSDGTTRVADIRTGTESSNPSDLIEFNGLLYFAADDGQAGEELWVSDGTEGGTELVSDINSGSGYQYPYGTGYLRSFPRSMTELNGELFFSAEDSISGAELWKTDGSEAGTVLVSDLAGGSFTDNYGTYPNSSSPSDFVNVNGTLFFTADDGVVGRELWKTDGTAAGTMLVKDLFDGDYPYYTDDDTYVGSYPNSSFPMHLTAVNGLLFFAATDATAGTELWRSDGTSDGTFVIQDIEPGSESSLFEDSMLLASGDHLYFTAETTEHGQELWISDGTEDGTELIRDIRTGSVGALSNPSLTNFKGEVYFAADDGVVGTELWKTDGTSDGTVLVSDLDDASTATFPRYLTDVNGTLFFSAFTSASGRELWESDGTEEGTQPVSEILAGSGSSSPQDLFAFENSLLFSADDGVSGRELYTVSATGPATARLVVYIDGEEVEIPANIGVDGDGDRLSQVTTSADGVLEVAPIGTEPLAAITLRDFFETWRTNAGQAGNNSDAIFDATQLLTGQVGGEDKLQMFVNGEVNSSFENYVIQDGDVIVVALSDNPIVSLNTTFGSLLFELFEDETPGTVENFLNYVNDGDYVNTFFHRSVPGFVIQGGGFETTSNTFTDVSQFSAIPTDGQIQNEPGISNVRGTIAMAKLGGQPDSATSQFFVNLDDNSTILDPVERDAFTVFGQVLDMTVADRIADLPIDFSNASPYGELPVDDDDTLVVIESVEGVGTVHGVKFVDANLNGVFDSTESAVAGGIIYVDANDNGVFDAGETSTTTDTDGNYSLDLAAGDYAIRSVPTSGTVITSPSEGFVDVTVEIGGDVEADFGEAPLDPPDAVILASASDTGILNDDLITRLDNSSADQTLNIIVTGVATGATVEVFANGTLIGTAVAEDSTVTVETDGTTALPEGAVELTATQTVGVVSSTASLGTTITVDTTSPQNIVSDPPQFVSYDETYTFDADSPDEGNVSYILLNAPTGMTIDAATGQINYSPTLTDTIPTTFQILVSDTAGNTIETTVDLHVLGVIPAFPDAYDVNEDETLTIDSASGILVNDGDPSSGTLTATLVAEATNGTVTLNADGSFEYVPDDDFFGTDSFTYRASDDTDQSNVARVTINVAPVNDPVQGTEDSYVATEDETLTIGANLSVLINDVDPDGDDLTVELANQPSHGTLQLNADGSFTYTPDANFFGTDSFAYRVFDGFTTSEPIAVQIDVQEVDDVPTAVADSYSVDEEQTLTVSASEGVLANDSDPDNDLTVTVSVEPTNGTLTLNSDGSFSYTPDVDFTGTDSFTYRATDGNSIASAAVTITVNNTADAPEASDDTATAGDDGAAVTIDVLDNDTTLPDVGDSLTVTDFVQAANGTVTFENGVFLYSANPGFTGEDSFTYTVTDTDGLTDTATVHVVVSESSGNSISGFVYLDRDASGTRDGGELGVPGALVTLTGESNTGTAISRSTLTDSTGYYEFTELPAGTYVVTQQQPAALHDGNEASDTATVVVGEDQLQNVVVSGNTSLEGNNFGEAGLAPAYMSIAWFFSSTTSVTSMLRETIARGEESVGNVDLARSIREQADPPSNEVPNRAPVGASDNYSVDESETLTVNAANGVLANDVDADSDALTATLVSDVTNGTLSLAANGSFTYTPDAGFVGTDSFTYRASDGSLTSAITTVTITVVDQPNTFNVVENSPNGTLVGRVETNASGELSFEFDDSSLPDDLILRPDDHLSGDPAAPIVVIEYLDLECPSCMAFHPLIEEMEDEFEGDILVVRRHFPLAVHEHAVTAGINAEAADRQGMFIEMVDLMFDRQDDWEEATDAQSIFNSYAQELGLDMTQFASDIADPDLEARVQRDLDAAGRLGLTATPSLFIQGEQVTIPSDADEFEELLEDALADFDEPFVINRTTGDIFVADGTQLDFESLDRFSLTVNVTDVDGVTTAVPITINVTNANEAAPVAFTDSYSGTEDVTLNVSASEGLLANDTDADNDQLTASLVTSPTNGTIVLAADGSFTYTPNAGFSGTDSFTYQANDGSLDSNVATVTLNISGDNDAPIAVADNYFVDEDDTLTTTASNGILVNDSDPDGDTLEAQLVDTTSNGSLTLNSDGTFTYTPDTDFEGTDSFTYQLTDGQLTSTTVTVTITVSDVNDAPVALNDGYTATEGQALVVNVSNGLLANDQDIDGDDLTVQLISGTSSGTLGLNADGSFTYTPGADFNGTDSFTYQAVDTSSATSNTATVTINVTAVNELPQAVDDRIAVTAGVPISVDATEGLTANDVDSDGDTLTVTLVSDVSHGTLTLNSDGSFDYTPDDGFVGTDEFTYVANDGTGDSNTAKVELVVNPINTFELLEDALDGALVGHLQLQDSDLDGDLSFEIVNADLPAELRLSVDDHRSGDERASVVLIEYLDLQCPACAAVHPFVEQLEANFSGDLLVVRRHFPLTSVHPLAVDAAVAAEAAGRQGAFDAMVDLLFDRQSEWTTASDLDATLEGYADDLGLDLTQFATDREDTALLDRVNRDLNDAQSLGLNATPTLFINGTEVETVPGDQASFDALIQAELDQVDDVFGLDRADGQIFVRDASQLDFDTTPTYSIDVRVVDADGEEEVITATINIVQVNVSVPVANFDAYNVDEDATLTITADNGVLNNDSDADGNSLAAQIETQAAFGTVTLNSDGGFVYVPNADYFGSDSFTYVVSDGTFESQPATVNITVDNVNDAPVAIADSFTIDENQTLALTPNDGLLANDLDADGDTLTAEVVDGPSNGALTLNADGSLTYTPVASFNGNDSFTYRVSDGTATSDPVAVDLTINDVNQAPIAKDDAYVVQANSTLSVDVVDGVIMDDTDQDGDSLVASIDTQPANGTVTLNADGSFDYIPNTDFSGTDSFTYAVSDGTAQAIGTVTITVNPPNTFTLAENSRANTVVGQLEPLMENLSAPFVFEIVDADKPSELRLRPDDHLSGDPDAPVVLIEYLDFECPACRAFHPVVQDLEQTFDGELLVVRRHLPLTSVHEHAFQAAVAAEAAGRQGMFDEMGDLLFTNQDDWNEVADPTAIFEGYAQSLGLNLTQYNNDIADADLTARVQRDLDDANALQAPGTPTFYLDGEQLSTPQSASDFEATIQAQVDADSRIFSLDRTTGQLQVVNAGALDFETTPTLTLQVRVTDMDGNSEVIDVTVNLTDENDTDGGAVLSAPLIDEALADVERSWSVN